jgi:hypothetical protein
MIVSIKNILSTQSSVDDACSPAKTTSKAKRAHTFYEHHNTSISDFDKSFESIEPRTPKSSLNRTFTQLNSSYFLSKVDSRVKIGESRPAKLRIKFTYSNNQL